MRARVSRGRAGCGGRSVQRRAVVLALWAAVLCAPAAPAGAETRWATGAPLEIRSGSSLGYRVLGQVEAGERVEVLQEGKGWARIRSAAGQEGWVVADQLDTEAPPRKRLDQLERETARLRGELAASQAEQGRLETAAGVLEGRGGERDAELERLLRDNARLSAGVRWVEWLVGASILAFGMLIGSLLRGVVSGRRGSRIRL